MVSFSKAEDWFFSILEFGVTIYSRYRVESVDIINQEVFTAESACGPSDCTPQSRLILKKTTMLVALPCVCFVKSNCGPRCQMKDLLCG